MNLLYRLFKIEDVSIDEYIRKLSSQQQEQSRSGSQSKSHSSSNRTCSYSDDDGVHIMDDELVNGECEFLFESTEKYSTHHTLNPNLSVCYEALLLKAFMEADVFESLLDLYFGIPVSFLQDYTLLLNADADQSCTNPKSVMYRYQMLSLKCLNLFAELYYKATILFYNEYCIDDFLMTPTAASTSFASPYSLNKSIFNEKKKIAVIHYMKIKNCPEREKEVIMYMTELYSKKEMLKNGMNVSMADMAKLSFFSQNFISNSGYLSSKE
jgi:hypothetical protein